MNNLPATQKAAPPATTSMYFDVAKFEHAYRVAKMMSTANMVPDSYKGNIGDCMIALEFAERVNAAPLMVMQAMQPIHGKPSLEGKLITALVNNCGRFTPIQFEETGDLQKPANGQDGCLAYATDIKSNTVLRGTMVTWDIVKGEGWLNKNGSKWKTMAPLMFRYRAATYFARIYCPEVLMGMQTREEVMDFVDARPDDSGTYAVQDATPDPNADTFDELVAKHIADDTPKGSVEAFVNFCAESNGRTPQQVQEHAAASFDDFWAAFTQWSKKSATQPTNESAGGSADRDGGASAPTADPPAGDDDEVPAHQRLLSDWQATLKGKYSWIEGPTLALMSEYGHLAAEEISTTWPLLMGNLLKEPNNLSLFCEEFLPWMAKNTPPGELGDGGWNVLRYFPGGFGKLRTVGLDAFFNDYAAHIEAAPDNVKAVLRKRWEATHKETVSGPGAPCPLDVAPADDPPLDD